MKCRLAVGKGARIRLVDPFLVGGYVGADVDIDSIPSCQNRHPKVDVDIDSISRASGIDSCLWVPFGHGFTGLLQARGSEMVGLHNVVRNI